MSVGAAQWIALSAQLFAGAGFGSLWLLLPRRSLSRPAASAWRAFRAWWAALAATFLLAAAASTAALASPSAVGAVTLLVSLQLAAAAAAAGAVTAYLAFLFTGRTAAARAALAYYVAVGALLVGVHLWSRPVAVELGWTVRLVRAEVLPVPVRAGLLALLVAPPFLGGARLAALGRRIGDAQRRRRARTLGTFLACGGPLTLFVHGVQWGGGFGEWALWSGMGFVALVLLAEYGRLASEPPADGSPGAGAREDHGGRP